MSFNPQALNERTLKQFVDRLHGLRKAQPSPAVWPPKRSVIQEEIAQILGFTSWHHAIAAVRPKTISVSAPSSLHAAPTDQPVYPEEGINWDKAQVDHFLDWASHEQSASDITFQDSEKVFLEVYGRMFRSTRYALDHDQVMSVLVALYGSESVRTLINSNRDVDFPYQTAQGSRFRVCAVGIMSNGRSGVQITIRSVPNAPPPLSLLYPELPDTLYSALFSSRSGINVVCGQTSSGKSTLIASFMGELMSHHENRKVGTYEAPIEFDLSHLPSLSSMLTQTDISGSRMSFHQAVLNATRRKLTDVVLEVRDPETVSEVLAASASGHRLWCSVHAPSVSNALRRLVSVFEKEDHQSRFVDVISSVNTIICQALVPSSDGKRTALREVLVLDDTARGVLLDAGVTNITAATQELLRHRQSDFLSDARHKHARCLIADKTLSLYEKSAALPRQE